jgi:uncharacterized protein
MRQLTWSARKAAANKAKHGVSFEEAATVFADPLARIRDDEPRLSNEPRELILGESAHRRLLVVCYRESVSGLLRIISARMATKRERSDYEEGTAD